jgi:hypothetical protein
MDAKEINSYLFRHFANYDYRLNNTYVFNWESDFFAQSKSGYFIECEIKISKADFKKDFGKEKHRLFSDILKGRTHHVYRMDNWWREGDILIKDFEIKEFRSRYGNRIDTTKPLIERNPFWNRKAVPEWRRKRYIVNDWQRDDLGIHSVTTKDIHAPTSRIEIKAIAEINTPHQFYFACPEGLIQVSDLPAYAGLLWIKKSGLEVIKRAPYMHKRGMDLSKELLKKYYNLWEFKVPHETKLQIRNKITV